MHKFMRKLIIKLIIASLFIAPQLSYAERVISLAPHLTEMMYSAGAGNQLVGTVNYSDYPSEAKKLAIIGGYSNLNYEKIISLNPDVVLYWQGGNQAQAIKRLQQLGINVLSFKEKTLDDIPQTILKLGKRFHTENHARKISQQLTQQLQQLKTTYQHHHKVTVFYQIWDAPLMTIGKPQFLNEAIELCGGQNIFNDQLQPAPQVSLESVLARNPQIILLGGQKQKQQQWQTYWQQFTQLHATQNQQIYLLNADHFQRPTARLIHALPALCQTINQAINQAKKITKTP